jgi:hypothetical protein
LLTGKVSITSAVPTVLLGDCRRLFLQNNGQRITTQQLRKYSQFDWYKLWGLDNAAHQLRLEYPELDRQIKETMLKTQGAKGGVLTKENMGEQGGEEDRGIQKTLSRLLGRQ